MPIHRKEYPTFQQGAGLALHRIFLLSMRNVRQIKMSKCEDKARNKVIQMVNLRLQRCLSSKECVLLPEDQHLFPSTHVRWLTAAYNSSTRGSDSLFQPPQATTNIHSARMRVHTHTHQRKRERSFHNKKENGIYCVAYQPAEIQLC